MNHDTYVNIYNKINLDLYSYINFVDIDYGLKRTLILVIGISII